MSNAMRLTEVGSVWTYSIVFPSSAENSPLMKRPVGKLTLPTKASDLKS